MEQGPVEHMRSRCPGVAHVWRAGDGWAWWGKMVRSRWARDPAEIFESAAAPELLADKAAMNFWDFCALSWCFASLSGASIFASKLLSCPDLRCFDADYRTRFWHFPFLERCIGQNVSQDAYAVRVLGPILAASPPHVRRFDATILLAGRGSEGLRRKLAAEASTRRRSCREGGHRSRS